MNRKTVYLWGPISTFTAPLAAWLLAKGWHVHIATKSALNILSFSSLDLSSTAKDALEDVFGTHNKLKAFQDRLKFIDSQDLPRNTTYDALIFAGLPPNFDDPRVPRASWAASELPTIARRFKGIPIFMISSLWGGIQSDRVVPEELEFERRKARHHWEKTCQNYELKLIESLSHIESPWYLVRLPLLTGSTANGYSFAFTGLANLFAALDPGMQDMTYPQAHHKILPEEQVHLAHEPDATLWFLPVDIAVYMFWRFLEDDARPRICNLVSTQATLNREWLHYLAQALGLRDFLPVQKDNLQLPLVLKKLLLDNVQVKTRNLFEVAGRYQIRSEKLDEDYFARLVQTGREKYWGKNKFVMQPRLNFSQDFARYYFEKFMPRRLTNDLMHKIGQGNTSVGFKINNANNLGWILKIVPLRTGNANGDGAPVEQAVVEPYAENIEKPKVCFHFNEEAMARVAQGQLSLHQAMLLKEVIVEGHLLDKLRVTQLISHFVKENPLKEFPEK